MFEKKGPAFTPCILAKTKQIHNTVDKLPFVTRYRTRTIDPAAHTLHLLALRTIYQELERKIAQFGALPTMAVLHVCNKALLNQSEKITNDLRSLESKTGHIIKGWAPSKPLTQYLQTLSKETHSEVILAHALVRYLGDLYGGQKIKEQIKETDPSIPACFYDFVPAAKTVRSEMNSHANKTGLMAALNNQPDVDWHYTACVASGFALLLTAASCLISFLPLLNPSTICLYSLTVGLGVLAASYDRERPIERFDRGLYNAFSAHVGVFKEIERKYVQIHGGKKQSITGKNTDRTASDHKAQPEDTHTGRAVRIKPSACPMGF